ncbi:MAG: Glucose-6-phosphate 3-dehydrogenase [Lentisphaerae bacterium ADurb.Bin242]|nr:MAG: Glucose-6-phosphate 3-dehydrogenase [Lentisphaerae bacterium ADurb.Bin242]
MIRLGLYGSGNRTRALLNSLLHDKFYKVHAVYDINRDSAETLVRQFGGAVCNSAEELAGFPGVDAFLISLSPFAHAEALRQTIPAGKPVFVEKPVSFSTAEVHELSMLAKQHNVPVQVGFMRRYLPESIAALKYIGENEPGHIFSVDCNWFHHGETEMNFCLYHQPDNFRLKVSQIPFHCCHALDIMILLGGKVKRVVSRRIKVIERPYPSPDDVISLIEFENGSSGHFHYSSMVYYTEMSYRFHCENYSIRLNAGSQPLEICRRPRFISSRTGPDPSGTKDFGLFNESYEAFCRPMSIGFGQSLNAANENIMYEFVRMVRDGIPPKASLEAAVGVQGLAEAIELSGVRGVPVGFTPEGIPVEL